MHLLLGDSQDICCLRVSAALAARGSRARILSNPLSHPERFSWRLDNWHSSTHLHWDGGQSIDDREIAGVLVRNPGFIESDGWRSHDLAYVHAETQAALLGWLWSLACPVINRYPASIWYRPQATILFWQPWLQLSGIPVIEMLISNVDQESRAFGQRLGAVYAPLTSDARYLIGTEDEWAGLAAMQQRCSPVCLTHPHGVPHLACVVGEQVVWEGTPPDEAAILASALRRFAAAAGLAFVEVLLANTAGGIRAVAVEPFPFFEHFGDSAQQEIVAGLVQLLTTESTALSCPSLESHL